MGVDITDSSRRTKATKSSIDNGVAGRSILTITAAPLFVFEEEDSEPIRNHFAHWLCWYSYFAVDAWKKPGHRLTKERIPAFKIYLTRRIKVYHTVKQVVGESAWSEWAGVRGGRK